MLKKARRMSQLDPKKPDDRVELGLEKDITKQVRIIDKDEKN